MARPRKYTVVDTERTEELNIDGLEVYKTDETDSYYTVLLDDEEIKCPNCHRDNLKNKGGMEHYYRDAIPLDDGGYKPVCLRYYYYKYKCLECGHVFVRPIQFAQSLDVSITNRYYDFLIKSCMHRSYRTIGREASEYLSPPAIMAYFNSWYESMHIQQMNEDSKYTPRTMGIVAIETVNYSFFSILDAGADDIRVLDVIPGIYEKSLYDALSEYDMSSVETFLTDCNVTILSAISQYFPKQNRIIAPGFLADALKRDFTQCVRNDIYFKHAYQFNKYALLMMSRNELRDKKSKGDQDWVNEIIGKSETLGDAYIRYNDALDTVEGRRDYIKIFSWRTELPEGIREVFSETDYILDTFAREISNGFTSSENIPEGFYEKVSYLQKTTNAFWTNKTEIVRSRILYIDMLGTDLMHQELPKQNGQWRGVSLDKVIENFRLIKKNGTSYYMRRKKHGYE